MPPHPIRRLFGFAVASIFVLLAARANALEIPAGMPAWQKLPPEFLQDLLEKGDLVSVHPLENNIELCVMGVLAKVPPEKVWDVIVDFKGYANLIPGFTNPEVQMQTGKNARVKFVISVLQVGPINITTDYTLSYKFDAPRHAEIDWVEGKVKNIKGFWDLIPVNGGRETLVIYAITSDLSSASPLVAVALKEQPSTVTAINLSTAILLTKKVVEAAEGGMKGKSEGSKKPFWRDMDALAIDQLLGDMRIGYIQKEPGGGERATAALVVNAGLEKTWGVLTDFEKYPEMIDQISEAKVLKRTDDYLKVQQSVDIMKIGFLKIGSDSVSEYKLKPPTQMISKDETTEGREDLYTLAELAPIKANRTALFYSTASDMRTYGKIASFLLDKQPSFQIAIDLALALTITDNLREAVNK